VSGRRSLWRLVVARACDHVLLHELWRGGRDRGQTEALLLELYALGERPDAHEFRRYLAAADRGKRGDEWQREFAALWSKRLRSPHRHPGSLRSSDGYPWDYPFCLPETVAEENGLLPLGQRLVDVLTAAAEEYESRARSSPGSPETERAEYAVRAALHNLRMWGHTRDRVEDASWPATALRAFARRSAPRPQSYTKSGKARYEAWLEVAQRRWEKEQPGA
jgi:hypothetical protein